MKTLMRNGRDRRSENPFLGHARKERVSLFGTDQRITSGPAATRLHSKAEYMTAPERFADSQIPLAPRAPSIHDPLRPPSVHRNAETPPICAVRRAILVWWSDDPAVDAGRSAQRNRHINWKLPRGGQCNVGSAVLPQHFLNFLPEPQGQGPCRPTFVDRRSCSRCRSRRCCAS